MKNDYVEKVAKETVDMYLSSVNINEVNFEENARKNYDDLYKRGEKHILGSDFGKSYARKEDLSDLFRKEVENEKFRISTSADSKAKVKLLVVDYPEMNIQEVKDLYPTVFSEDAPTAKRKVRV
jgi:hypothetical protein